MKEAIGTILRLVLKAGGGALVAKGITDEGTVETIIGAIITIFGAVWGWYAAKQAASARQADGPAANIAGPLGLVLVGLILTGCATGAQRPPSPSEQKYFTVQTNFVPVVVAVTNASPATETSPAVATVAVQTNQQEQYTFTPNQNAAAVITTGGAVGTFWGVGGIVSTVLAGLFGLYGLFRSRKAELTAQELAQIIETGRQVLLTLPNGTLYEAKWKDWMIKHQKETETVAQVALIVNTAVDNDKAKGAAQTIINLIEAAKA